MTGTSLVTDLQVGARTAGETGGPADHAGRQRHNMLAALSYGDRMVATVVCSPESAHLLDLLTVDLAEGLAEVAAGA